MMLKTGARTGFKHSGTLQTLTPPYYQRRSDSSAPVTKTTGMITCPCCLGARVAQRANVGGKPIYPGPWDGDTAPGFAKQYFAPGTIWPGYSAPSQNPQAPSCMLETCPTCKGDGVLWL